MVTAHVHSHGSAAMPSHAVRTCHRRGNRVPCRIRFGGTGPQSRSTSDRIVGKAQDPDSYSRYHTVSGSSQSSPNTPGPYGPGSTDPEPVFRPLMFIGLTSGSDMCTARDVQPAHTTCGRWKVSFNLAAPFYRVRSGKPQRLRYTALIGTSSSARSRQPPEPESPSPGTRPRDSDSPGFKSMSCSGLGSSSLRHTPLKGRRDST
jgi:hypothetical protein